MVDLAAAKSHLRVDYDDEDNLITGMIAAASSHLASIGVDMDASPLPAAIEQAQFLLIAHFYENREATGPATNREIDFGVDRLIAPYREAGI